MKKYPVIIPARAGSKGIIGKNIIEFCGEPLIAWSIKQALDSSCVSNVYVSTDGKDIANISESYGAKVIMRPEELASDISTSESAIIHAIQEIEKEEQFESLIFLQATSPIRRRTDIDNAVAEFIKGRYDSLFSMAVLDDYCLWEDKNNELTSVTYDYRNRGRRQDRKPLYLENGSIYVFSKKFFLKEKNRIGGKIGMYEMPFECSYEIDSMKDIKLCEYFFRHVLEGQK